MLRVLVLLGLLLMAVGFGAAGWQYYQSLTPGAPTIAADEPAALPPQPAVELSQTWLISPTGGLVPQDQVRTYLVQSRFVKDRRVIFTRGIRLADLLAEGEKLPDTPYLQVLADIRAPKAADGLCAVLTASLAEECALKEARVVEGSVDLVAGTATIAIELVFRETSDGSELPDLAAHVLRSEAVRLDLAAGVPGSESAEAALAMAVDLARTSCAAEHVGQACRVQNIVAGWSPGQPLSFRAQVAWLDPLPDGVFAAPPLEPAPEG
jgi:hypothetical protein